MTHTPTYDQKCYDLAALFLGDEPELHTKENMEELAYLIQQAIEDYIAGDPPPMPRDPRLDYL